MTRRTPRAFRRGRLDEARGEEAERKRAADECGRLTAREIVDLINHFIDIGVLQVMSESFHAFGRPLDGPARAGVVLLTQLLARGKQGRSHAAQRLRSPALGVRDA